MHKKCCLRTPNTNIKRLSFYIDVFHAATVWKQHIPMDLLLKTQQATFNEFFSSWWHVCQYLVVWHVDQHFRHTKLTRLNRTSACIPLHQCQPDSIHETTAPTEINLTSSASLIVQLKATSRDYILRPLKSRGKQEPRKNRLIDYVFNRGASNVQRNLGLKARYCDKKVSASL